LPDPIDVPPEAFAAKPIFPDFPSSEIVAEVREWVKTQPPWAWRGHTHAKPDENEAQEIRYVADFQLPKGVESPCPCCTPRHAKFGKGFIAWFPRTSCVRLMGQDCFKTLNPEGHQFAVDEFDERQKRTATIAYLTANIEKRFEAIEAIERALPIAEHIDTLQDSFGEDLRRTIGVDMWQQVRDGGRLKVAEETNRGPIFSTYATIEGAALVDPGRKKIAPSLRTAMRALQSIDLPLGIVNTNDQQRELAAKSFSRGMRLAVEALATINECKAFLSVLTLATLRNWGAQEAATASLYVRRQGLDVSIGRSEGSVRRITLEPCIDGALPRLPEISL
jgi:hypothetical protein